jgi:hypothetical protein
MSDLSVDVNRNDIMVSKPSSGLSVTYRRTGRVLVALDSMRKDPKGEELIFLVRAWKAAFAKARSLTTDQNAAWWLRRLHHIGAKILIPLFWT